MKKILQLLQASVYCPYISLFKTFNVISFFYSVTAIDAFIHIRDFPSKRHAKAPVLKNILGFEKPVDFCHLSKVILEVFL